jgi:hypothetical protein
MNGASKHPTVDADMSLTPDEADALSCQVAFLCAHVAQLVALYEKQVDHARTAAALDVLQRLRQTQCELICAIDRLEARFYRPVVVI